MCISRVLGLTVLELGNEVNRLIIKEEVRERKANSTNVLLELFIVVFIEILKY